jgi:beta-mannosidase
VLVSPHVEEGSVKVYIVSDKTEAQAAKLRLRLMDFDGKVLLEEKQDVSVSPLTSKVYADWPFLKLTQAGATDTSRVFVVAELMAGGTTVSRNLTYLAPVKEVHLKPATLQVDASGANGKLHIKVGSPVLARSVYVSFGNLDAKVSDNYFDLLPGETVEITAETKAGLDEVKAQMKVTSLTDAFAVNPQGATIGAAQ